MQSLFPEFDKKEKEESNFYTSKIKTPVYTPKPSPPSLLEILDDSKSKKLIREIEATDLSDNEKYFLIEAAKRHNVFNYQKVADYYASASAEMQDLMEKSALVIIDFEKAYQLGYIKLAHEIASKYIEQYNEKHLKDGEQPMQ